MPSIRTKGYFLKGKLPSLRTLYALLKEYDMQESIGKINMICIELLNKMRESKPYCKKDRGKDVS